MQLISRTVWLAAALLVAANTAAVAKDEPSAKANRLASESSPYLRQHANNPVDWYPWGKEAFEKARKEDKPILLSVGYSTCHWCHVMERESFSAKDVAEIVNKGFVAIKVDRERRPEVDEMYMLATQILNRLHLDVRRSLGHNNDRFQSQFTCRQRHALRMISR